MVALYIMSRLSYLCVWIKCPYELLHIKVQLDHFCYCHAMVDSYDIEMGHFVFVAAGVFKSSNRMHHALVILPKARNYDVIAPY
eukprot:scaffold21780_cov77-Skeletonema_marinoi.AAC.1